MSEPTRGPRYGRPNFDFFQQMASTPSAEDGPVFMINLMKYREIADYPGNPGSGLTGRQADDLYTPSEILSSIGAEIVFAADVERQLLGDAPKWDRVES